MQSPGKKISPYLGVVLLLLSIRSTLILNDLLTALVFVILGTSVLYYGRDSR
jgi:hypothetical protein